MNPQHLSMKLKYMPLSTAFRPEKFQAVQYLSHECYKILSEKIEIRQQHAC